MELTDTGRHKTATLLMNLDSTTVSRLLKGYPPEVVQQLAVEMAHIDATGRRNKKEEMKVVQEFYSALQGGAGNQAFNLGGFLNGTVVSFFGEQKAEEIQSNVKEAIEQQNPFTPMQRATADELVLALQSESAGTIAIVLSELEAKKAGEVLGLLEEDLCSKVVWNMTKPVQMRNHTKQSIAAVIGQKLDGFKGETLSENPEEILRKLAIVLSDTPKDVRDQSLEEVKEHDEEMATRVRDLMITWEDIPSITDRSLQETIRSVDSSRFAMALFGADEEIAEKIRSNISKRVAETIDEEQSLMQEPLEEEILEAREEVVKPLREANEAGNLRRIKR